MSQHQASTPVSPFRRRMLDDMALRGLHDDTQRNTVMSVRNFAAFLGRSPETATPEDVCCFQIHQAESGMQPPTVNNAVSGLSQRIRKRIEEGFGWGKEFGLLRRIRMRGRERVDMAFAFSAAACNLIRLPKLLAEPAVA